MNYCEAHHKLRLLAQGVKPPLPWKLAPLNFNAYVAYHGTPNLQSVQWKGLRPGSPNSMLGAGVYVTRDKRKARWFAIERCTQPPGTGVIIEVVAYVGKVFTITDLNHPLSREWSSSGYDTAYCPLKTDSKLQRRHGGALREGSQTGYRQGPPSLL